MNDDRQIAAKSRQIKLWSYGPIFTKISHDVVVLVWWLIRAFTKRCFILFGNARAKSEDGQFWRLQKGPNVN